MPSTGRGWAILLGTALVLAAVASLVAEVNPAGIGTFLLTFLFGRYVVAAWERRVARGSGDMPTPRDVAAEPVRSAHDLVEASRDSRFQTRDGIIQFGIGLIFLGFLIGLPLAFGFEWAFVARLGDLQPVIALGLLGAGGIIVAVRYAYRGRWT